jgi:glutamyl endopeptidase
MPADTLTAPTGLHQAITNEIETAEETTPIQQAPHIGKPGAEDKPRDEVEAIDLPVHAEALALEAAPNTKDLLDIGLASFPARALIPETVHGPDDRVQIVNTSNYPWRVHSSLLITARDGSNWIGTGWFIGPHTLITAGHCVYIKNSGIPNRDGWVTAIRVMLGRNAAQLPYGSVVSHKFYTVNGWANNGDENYDYAAIIIPSELGNQTGWFGFGVFSDADLTASVANISGYPGDKPEGTQWYGHHQVASVSPTKVRYDVDTMGGQSGSAVYIIRNGQRIGIAVHAYGGPTTNSGTRISNPVHANMLAWKQ